MAGRAAAQENVDGMNVRQVGWRPFNVYGIAWSTTPSPIYKRFYITRTTNGFTVVDKQTGEIERTTTLAAAQAWAGIRVGEQCVRHHR